MFKKKLNYPKIFYDYIIINNQKTNLSISVYIIIIKPL